MPAQQYRSASGFMQNVKTRWPANSTVKQSSGRSSRDFPDTDLMKDPFGSPFAVDDGAKTPDLHSLKRRAHMHADAYFSTHLCDDLVQFFRETVGETKRVVVGAMLGRIFCNKKPEDFNRLPKLFQELVDSDSVSSAELLERFVFTFT